MSEITNNELNMNPNTTTGLSAEMKTYYSDYLIDNAVPNLQKVCSLQQGIQAPYRRYNTRWRKPFRDQCYR